MGERPKIGCTGRALTAQKKKQEFRHCEVTGSQGVSHTSIIDKGKLPASGKGAISCADLSKPCDQNAGAASNTKPREIKNLNPRSNNAGIPAFEMDEVARRGR